MENINDLALALQTAPIAAIAAIFVYAVYKIKPDVVEYLKRRDAREEKQEERRVCELEARMKREAEMAHLSQRIIDVVEDNTKAFREMQSTNKVRSERLDEVKDLVVQTATGIRDVQTELGYISRDISENKKQLQEMSKK